MTELFRRSTDYSSYNNNDNSSGQREKGGFRVPGPMVGFLMVLIGIFVGSLLFTYEVKVGLGLVIEEKTSFYGVAGAWVTWLIYEGVGMAAFLLPVLLVWWGLYQMTHKGALPTRMIVAGILMLLFACVVLGGQKIVGVKWANDMGLPGLGGELGDLLGWELIVPSLGVYGTVALFSFLYVVCFIYFTGLKMWPFLKAVWRDYRSWRERRRIDEGWSPDDLDHFEEERSSLGALPLSKNRQEEAYPTKPSYAAEPSYREETSSIREEEPIVVVRREEYPSPAPAPEPRTTSRRSPRKVEEKQSEPETMALPLRPAPQIIDTSIMRVVKTAEYPEIAAKEAENAARAKAAEDEAKKYILPGLNILNEPPPIPEGQNEQDRLELLATQDKIIDILKQFKIEVTPGDITKGPTITRYEIYPSYGTQVSKISRYVADIARATMAERINILAPIPGKDTVGIEIANSKKVAVPLRELLVSPDFTDSKKKIPLALGKDVYGNVVVGDLAAMPHLLVAGATGSGKSVCINSIISSILFKFTPEELKFILVDPKVVEMQGYAKLPHLIVPVVTEPKKVIGALRWAVNEMERRYRIFADAGVRNFESYNNRPRDQKPSLMEDEEEEPEELSEDDLARLEATAQYLEGEGEDPYVSESDHSLYDEMMEEEEEIPDKFPYLVIIIDELADLMQTVSNDMEAYIARITAKARAAGIHLIVATQTPRSEVVTGTIKANIPCRIAFQVSSGLDSRIILDRQGAENLVGKGDLYYLPPGSAKLERAQGAFISDEEVEDLVRHCSAQAKPSFRKEAQEQVEMGVIEEGSDSSQSNDSEEEDILRCVEVIKSEGRASVSLLQRKLRFGFNRAARCMELMEKRGLVGPPTGPTKQREIYV